MVAEGCSDVHLSGGQKPRWRIDGEMKEIGDTAILGPSEVRELLAPIMDERASKGFDEDNEELKTELFGIMTEASLNQFNVHDSADFAHSIPDVARFRVNVFRDKGGIGSVMRQIPAKILTF